VERSARWCTGGVQLRNSNAVFDCSLAGCGKTHAEGESRRQALKRGHTLDDLMAPFGFAQGRL
jgi:hypothetical protein